MRGLSPVSRWAANGALSGAGAAAILIWVDGLNIRALQNPAFFILPGLIFGLVVAIPLWHGGLARGWAAAVFLSASVIAWPAAWYVGGGLLLAIDGRGPLRLALAGGAGGLVWAAILTGAAAIFPFMRKPRAWLSLAVAGGLAGAFCVSLLEILSQWGFGVIYIVLWGVWYAVYGGLMATYLPEKRSVE